MNDQTPQTPATPDGAASVLTVRLGKRLMKCLKNVERHKYHDFDAVLMLEEKGYIAISGTSDDLSIEITEIGKAALLPNVLADRREPVGEASSPKGDGRAAG